MTTKSNIENAVVSKWFPVRELVVKWPNAQRPIRPAHLKALMEGFDPELFDAIHVSAVVQAPTFRHIIDGNHRKTMIEQLFGPNEMVPCMIHQDCTTEARAAEIFREINKSRKAPTAVEDFKVAVAEGSEVHVEIDKIVRKAGFTINSGDGKVISAVQALLMVHSRYGVKALDAAVKVLRDTWPDDRNAFQGSLILGCGALMFDHPKLDRERLASRLAKKFSPGTLLAAAKAVKQATAKPIATEVRQVLINYYNIGLKETSKLRAMENDENTKTKHPFRALNGAAKEDHSSLN